MFESRAEGLAQTLPAAVSAAALFDLSCCILLSEAFRAGGEWSPTGYIEFFAKPLNRTVATPTLKLGALVTAASAVIGSAAAFAIIGLSLRLRGANLRPGCSAPL